MRYANHMYMLYMDYGDPLYYITRKFIINRKLDTNFSLLDFNFNYLLLFISYNMYISRFAYFANFITNASLSYLCSYPLFRWGSKSETTQSGLNVATIGSLYLAR